MFWSGNYIVVRELNFLLKEENVSLSQVLEAEDILQECKANNKALIQFLTRPEILAELVTLITEEPPQHVDLMCQYQHASIACEVLTSQLSTLSDHLSMDTVQMHRLCDFLNREPPLNPLLASYFSKTIEMLLERNQQQDWYQYHIVCLRVLDFFKSRRDFMPNLLRHLSTSAIADTFKYFIRVGDLCHRNVTEWLEENQFLECLIQIICGTYVPEPLGPPVAPTLIPGRAEAPAAKPRDEPEKADTEDSEKKANHKEEDSSDDEIRVNNNISHEADTSDTSTLDLKPRSQADESSFNTSVGEDKSSGGGEQSCLNQRQPEHRVRRMQAVASANAASLLCDIILTGCATEGCTNRHTRTSYELVQRLCREECVRCVLAGVFTAPPPHARTALLGGCRLLLALLHHAAAATEGGEAQRTSVEVAIAPHLPLLHQALIRHTDHQDTGSGEGGAGAPARVGEARLQAAAVLAQLATSPAEEVATTMVTLGTPGAVVGLVFRYPHNNLLHAHALALLRNALDNAAYRTQYARHLLIECDLLTRLMDAFEENEAKKCSPSCPRAAYMGHVVVMLSNIALALHPAHYDLAERLPLPPALLARWKTFHDETLRPLLQRHDTPLGGSYPSETVYDAENMDLTEPATYDFSDMQTAEIDDLDDLNEMCRMPAGGEAGAAPADDNAASDNLEEFKKMLGSSDKFGSDMWEDDLTDPDEISRAVQELYCNVSPWDSADKSPNTAQETSPEVLALVEGCGTETPAVAPVEAEGWASFDAFSDAPVDPFTGDKVETAHVDQAAWEAADRLDQADQWQQTSFSPFWDSDDALQEPPSALKETNTKELEQNLREMTLEQNQPLVDQSIELANNLLTAMSSMAPDDIANLVNANLPAPGANPPMSESTVLETTLTDPTIEKSTSSESTTTETEKPKAVTTLAVESGDNGKEKLPITQAAADSSLKEDATPIPTSTDIEKSKTEPIEVVNEIVNTERSVKENVSTESSAKLTGTTECPKETSETLTTATSELALTQKTTAETATEAMPASESKNADAVTSELTETPSEPPASEPATSTTSDSIETTSTMQS